ncbi:MAG: methyl-accepting chemotaxis protein [Deltaproteobacteria bacterium]|nr:methyl-accepting chemotaxis protein [Deltaproteobacteria bacterium]
MTVSHDTHARRASRASSHPTSTSPAQEAEIAALRAEVLLLREWVGRVAHVSDAVASGDLEHRLPQCEDDPSVARMVRGLNRLLDVTDAFVREAKASLTYASHGKFFRRVLLKGMPGTFRQASGVINEATLAMERQAGALRDAEKKRVVMADEFEHSIKEVVSTLAASATEMRATAESLARMAKETTDQAKALSKAAEDTAVGVQAVASASEELSSSATEIGRQVSDSSEFVAGAVGQAERTTTVVGGLTQASTQIGHVVKLISEIAKQTNLLALNATIEAARAGEVGRGFAVVASEVKNLARQTSDATDQIADRIGAIQTATRDGVDAVGGVGAAITRVEGCFGGIATAIGEQRQAAAEIARNVSVAARGTEAVSRGMQRVTQNARETDDAVEQLLVAAQDLSRQAEGLLASTTSFIAVVRG